MIREVKRRPQEQRKKQEEGGLLDEVETNLKVWDRKPSDEGAPPPPAGGDPSYDFEGTDWDLEEEMLNRQALEAKRSMALLAQRRNKVRFAKAQAGLKAKYTEHLRSAKHATERELQSRVASLRAEAADRMSSVASFKSGKPRASERGWSERARGWSERARGWSGRARGWSEQARGWSERARVWSQRARGWSERVRG
jgi:hypothetical protein